MGGQSYMNHAIFSRRTVGPLLAVILILSGCKGAGAPLGEPDEMTVDAGLTGTWESVSDDEDKAILRVWVFNDHEYYVEWETEDDETDVARLRAYSSDLGDFLFSNIQCINCDEDDRSEWFFFQYELESSDMLLLRSVADEHYTDALSSMTRSRDVRRYVEQHMHDAGFFEDNVARFRRVEAATSSD